MKIIKSAKNKLLKATVQILCLCLLIPSLGSCTSENIGIIDGSNSAYELYSKSYFDCFDTLSFIKGYAVSEEEFNTYADIFYTNLSKYNKLFDIYKTYDGVNNLKTVNDNAGVAPVKVDEELIELIEFCISMNELTNGMTNVAMGSVLKIWHTHREAGSEDPTVATLPDMDKLNEAAEHTDINNIVIDKENSTIYLSDAKMSLDVGAVAKGWATNKISNMLKDAGLKYAAISIGGNIEILGTHADGSDWTVAVTNPDYTAEKNYTLKLALSDYTLVTSGSYERYYVVDGVRYHHIIHPDTLMPCNNFVSVSILTDDSGMADALSTALFNMDYESGLALIESLDHTEAYWIYPDGTEKFSSGFEAYVISE